MQSEARPDEVLVVHVAVEVVCVFRFDLKDEIVLH